MHYSLTLASWSLAAAVFAQWVLIRWLGDVWWLGTVAMFAPRWPLLLPIAVVAAACALWQRRLLWLHAASALVLLGPMMGFCVPSPFAGGSADGFTLRVMTANVGGAVRVESLRNRIHAADPDVIAFQESSSQLIEKLDLSDWHWRTARGLAVGSRFPIAESDAFEGSRLGRYHDYGCRARITTPAGDAWICCIYLDSPRDGFESLMVTRRGVFGIDAVRKNIAQRGDQSRLVSQWIAERNGPTIVAGDMNQPAESYFHRRDWSSWRDAYAAVGLGYGHTWFSSWHGLRIDHILADEHWRILNCDVAGPTGGDHRPVVAELVLGSQIK